MSKEHMERVCLFVAERQMQQLRSVSSQCGLNVSELVRRGMDHVLQETMLNAMVPSMSGQFQVRG